MARKPYKRTKTTSRNNNQRNVIIIGVVAVVAIVALGALAYFNMQPEPEIAGLITYPRPPRGHDNTLEIPFGERPPAGGVHNDVWQNCGIYDEPVDSVHAVHSLEHGAVWLTYQPDLAADEVAKLQELAQGQTYLLVSPYPEQRSPIVATAWGLQLEVDSADDGRVAEFIDRYRVGPQTPERGAACTGGLGEPVG